MARPRTKCDRCSNETRNRKDKETGVRLCNDCRKEGAQPTAVEPTDSSMTVDHLLMDPWEESSEQGKDDPRDEHYQAQVDRIKNAAAGLSRDVQVHITGDVGQAVGALEQAKAATEQMQVRVEQSTSFADDAAKVTAEMVLMGEDISTAGWIAPSQTVYQLGEHLREARRQIDLDLPPAPPVTKGDHPIHRELIDIIEHAITNHPRSQQVLIGPSEIGDPCARCLGKKLLGIPQTRGDAWLPTIGTAVHRWLDDTITDCDCGWHTEKRVTVGIIGNRIIKGSCDLFGKSTVVDHKVTGANTLKTVSRHGPPQNYRVQGHLYGRGYELEGEEVHHISLLFLPRNSPSLSDSIYWTEPYNRDIALAALERADHLAQMLAADPGKVIELPRATQCYDCYRYAQLPGEDSALDSLPKGGSPFEGLL